MIDARAVAELEAMIGGLQLEDFVDDEDELNDRRVVKALRRIEAAKSENRFSDVLKEIKEGGHAQHAAVFALLDMSVRGHRRRIRELILSRPSRIRLLVDAPCASRFNLVLAFDLVWRINDRGGDSMLATAGTVQRFIDEFNKDPFAMTKARAREVFDFKVAKAVEKSGALDIVVELSGHRPFLFWVGGDVDTLEQFVSEARETRSLLVYSLLFGRIYLFLQEDTLRLLRLREVEDSDDYESSDDSTAAATDASSAGASSADGGDGGSRDEEDNATASAPSAQGE